MKYQDVIKALVPLLEKGAVTREEVASASGLGTAMVGPVLSKLKGGGVLVGSGRPARYRLARGARTTVQALESAYRSGDRRHEARRVRTRAKASPCEIGISIKIDGRNHLMSPAEAFKVYERLQLLFDKLTDTP